METAPGISRLLKLRRNEALLMSLINLGIARNQGNCPYYSVSLSMLVQMIESYRLGLYGDLFITPS